MIKYNLKNFKLLIIFSLVSILLIYRNIFFGFFQQDEWLAFARHITANKEGLTGILNNSFFYFAGHYNPFTFLIDNLLFRVFSLNYLAYASASMFFHLIISGLVGYLSYLLLRNKFLGLAAGFLFAVMAAGLQATTWVFIDVNTHGAAFFGLLSVIFMFHFTQKTKMKYFYYSVISFVISLLFKEITVALFILLPVMMYLFSSSELKKSLPSKILGLVLVSYVLLRVFIQLHPSLGTESVGVSAGNIVTQIYNLASFPEKGVIQTILPQSLLLDLAYKIAQTLPVSITGTKFTTAYDIFTQNNLIEIENLALFGSLLVLLYLIFRPLNSKSLENWDHKIIFFSFSFILLNSLIYTLSPDRAGIISLIDSRNLYFPSIGTSILLISLLSLIKDLKVSFFILVFVLIGINVNSINYQLSALANDGQSRKAILNDIRKLYPTLPDKTIFFTQSNQSFYGLPDKEHIMPFQSGFGQTLLVWYQGSENYPTELLKHKFLWDIESQGYKEFNNQGFGYFRNFADLATEVSKNSFPYSNIISFRYDSQWNNLEDNSDEVRGSLRSYFSPKSLISPTSYTISAQTNTSDLVNLSDNNRNTFWDSKLSSNELQFLEFNLNGSEKVSEISLDSYQYNQAEIGYEVLLSSDQKNWNRVFYDKTIPNSSGKVNIYFKPQSTRSIRLIEVGDNPQSSWILDEVSLYRSL